MRSAEPTRLGIAVSQNSSPIDIVMPMFPRLRTMMVHSTQTLKPMFSAKMENMRFLRAMRCPVVAQNVSSSGSQ